MCWGGQGEGEKEVQLFGYFSFTLTNCMRFRRESVCQSIYLWFVFSFWFGVAKLIHMFIMLYIEPLFDYLRKKGEGKQNYDSSLTFFRPRCILALRKAWIRPVTQFGSEFCSILCCIYHKNKHIEIKKHQESAWNMSTFMDIRFDFFNICLISSIKSKDLRRCITWYQYAYIKLVAVKAVETVPIR